ncbi:MAG: hypothetical protein K2X93_05010 [Candidatus Obscuribacterales bacterium]|nr:hypothetical protein [Candidatus Obscuribacterales bacterium]
MSDARLRRAATIEINRGMVLREPSPANAERAQSGKLVALIRPEIPGAIALEDNISSSSNAVKNFRIVDGVGPLYEFRGIATCRGDFVEIAPVSSVSRLR